MQRLSTSRMIGIHFAGLAAIIICILLSQWQWSRAHIATAKPETLSSKDFFKLSPRSEFLPVGSIGVKTEVTGAWLNAKTFVLPNRSAHGPALLEAAPFPNPCDWIVTPIQLADDSVIAVVRGCSSDGAKPADVSGQVTVTGVLQPSERSSALKINSTVKPLTTELVVSKTDSSAHDGYLVSWQPTAGLTRVEPILGNSPKVPLHWRNVFYTFNWLFFALIVLAMWVRVVKDELNEESKEN